MLLLIMYAVNFTFTVQIKEYIYLVATLLTKEKPLHLAQVWSLAVPKTAVEAGALLSGSIATVLP
jgi:hypothetical protein